jgi:hypothetical protein
VVEWSSAGLTESDDVVVVVVVVVDLEKLVRPW